MPFTRIAALYDIHGNLPALEAVLDELRGEPVDLIVVGGDVFPGPMPRETLACLLDLGVPTRFISGNGDREVLSRMRGGAPAALPASVLESISWVAGQLDRRDEEALAGWPATLRMGIEGIGDVLFCHATPRNDTDIFTRETDEARLLPVFSGLDVPLVVCGHTHMQFDRPVGPVRVVNAGSVGMPFAAPGAYWLLLGPDVQFRRTAYDLGAAAARVRATSYPQAAEFAERNVLHPPSEQEMAGLFAKAELSRPA
jgi:predicted phosphodiesterase